MKLSIILLSIGLWAAAISARAVTPAAEIPQPCLFIDNAPQGVFAWEQSDLVRTPGNSRFVDYASGSAETLVLDATVERSVSRDAEANPRRTTVWTVWNERGWYIYIRAEEPLVQNLLDTLVDPKSPGRSEMYEVFFTPGLHEVPYYQMMIYPYVEKVSHVDWGMPHRNYRSLSSYVKVESQPLKVGVGTFIFVPWEALYERLPLEGATWRLSVIRWMPFAKAGGVTMGGQVHETGRFCLLEFQPPTPEQKLRARQRLLRSAWFSFQAEAKAAETSWSDAKVGDPLFFENVLEPEIEKQRAFGLNLGEDPYQWKADTLPDVTATASEWFEFRYKISELRTAYLLDKRMSIDGEK